MITQIRKKAQEHFQALLSRVENPQKLAVLIVDLQENYISIGNSLFEKRVQRVNEVIDYSNEVVTLALQNNVPCLEINNKGGGQSQVKSQLELFRKNERSALKGVNEQRKFLLDVLRERGIEILFIIGLHRDACVYETIRDFTQLRFIVYSSWYGTCHSLYGQSPDEVKSKVRVKNAKEKFIRLIQNSERKLRESGVIFLDEKEETSYS